MTTRRRNYYEPHIQGPIGPLYEELIKYIAQGAISEGAVVIDGGCNAGMHTITFARLVGPKGVVHAIDPVEVALERNRKWAASSGVDSVIRYTRAALSDAAGSATFNLCEANPAFSSLHLTQADKEYTSVTVPTVRLDDIVSTPADFIKLDCEGGEFNALRGAERILGESDCIIVFENARNWAAKNFGYTRDDFFGLFSRHGFGLFDGFGEPFGPQQWEDFDTGYYFIAVKPDGRFDQTPRVAARFWESRSALPVVYS